MSLPTSSLLRPRYLLEAEKLRQNAEQWGVFESRGNCVVLAGPGSGKTKVLTVKLARMLREDVVPPHGIACITYSTECARELKRRLASLGVYEDDRIFVGTVHSFCLQHLVRPFGDLAGLKLPKNFRVPDRKTAVQVFEEAARNCRIKLAWDSRSRFDRLRRTTFSKAEAQLGPEYIALRNEHERLLRAGGYVDFDDMMLLGLRLVRDNAWIREVIRCKFPVLVVDEYQDLGLPLDVIVRELCFHAGVRILAVGDPDQSIYGFTGADPGLLVQLSSEPSVEAIRLRLNYRCGREIVVSSLDALQEPRDYEPAGSEAGELTFWQCPQGIDDQVATTIGRIIPDSLAARPDRALGDIAVLYIDRFDAARITSAVKRLGMKFTGGDAGDRYAATVLTRWVEDCSAWCAGGWRDGQPRLADLLRVIKQVYGSAESSQDLERLEVFVSFLMSTRDPSLPLDSWFKALLNPEFLKALKRSDNLRDDIQALREMWIAICGAKDTQPTLRNYTIGDLARLRGTSEHLNLTTLHSSKGLEYDVVIMIGLEEGRIPRYGLSSDSELREARRLFYVGLTRARYAVHLLYSGHYSTSKGRFSNGPSRFVVELQEIAATRLAERGSAKDLPTEVAPTPPVE